MTVLDPAVAIDDGKEIIATPLNVTPEALALAIDDPRETIPTTTARFEPAPKVWDQLNVVPATLLTAELAVSKAIWALATVPSRSKAVTRQDRHFLIMTEVVEGRG